MNMDFIGKMPIPKLIKKRYPLPESAAALKAERDAVIRDILDGRDPRLLLLIGPCSADREDAVLEYMTRLRGLQERVAEKIFMVPRLYTTKPRSNGGGYKGMLHSPEPGEKPDLIRGVIATRQLHMRVLTDCGFSCADEMLYPENHRYLSDLLSYAAVGARSTEDQQHRLTASGLNIPVGMKNPMGGDLSAMVNAVYAARRPHTFAYRGWEVRSRGNPYAHGILRGYTDISGRCRPNYHYEDLQELRERFAAAEIPHPAVLVDASHGNSGKNPLEQPRICREVLRSRRESGELRDFVRGLMVESYLEDGAQSVGGTVFGRSITDPCLGWEKSERLVLELAELL